MLDVQNICSIMPYVDVQIMRTRRHEQSPLRWLMQVQWILTMIKNFGDHRHEETLV